MAARTIWLASYPKSGNTWMRMLVANLSATDAAPANINNLPESGGIASGRDVLDQTLLIESGLLTHDETDRLRPLLHASRAEIVDGDAEFGEPRSITARFVKVHDAYTVNAEGEPLLAGSRGADGAIVIVRDPRDVAPSLANHLNTGIDRAIEFMNDQSAAFCHQPGRFHAQLRQQLPGWSGHVASWLDQTDIPIHVLRYEDMHADTVGALRAALAFAQRPVTEDDLQRAVRHAEFHELERQERANGFREAPPKMGAGGFFRRGVAGAWRDELTQEQIARLESAHAPMMRRLGYLPAADCSPTRTDAQGAASYGTGIAPTRRVT